MQSAIGRVLTRKLGRSVEARRSNANLLTRELSSIPGLRVTRPGPHIYHSYYKYYVFVRSEDLAPDWNRARIMEAICAEGIPCFTGGCSEVYLEKAFTHYGFPKSRLPVAKELGETSLMFMVHPTLTSDDISDTCAAVRKVMMRAVRETCTRPLVDSGAEHIAA